MKIFALVAAAFAITESELELAATPSKAVIEAQVKSFAAKMRSLKATIKKLQGEDQAIRKAFFKKHAKSVKGWVAQRKAMKAKFIATLKLAKASLKKAGIKAQVQQLKAMDKKLAMTVKADVTRFFKEGMALDKARMAVAKKNVGPKLVDAVKSGKAAAKAIFA